MYGLKIVSLPRPACLQRQYLLTLLKMQTKYKEREETFLLYTYSLKVLLNKLKMQLIWFYWGKHFFKFFMTRDIFHPLDLNLSEIFLCGLILVV